MNIYVVTSDPIEYVEHVPGMFGGPMMEYSIGEIVAAETRGGAKWLAWRADKTRGWGCAHQRGELAPSMTTSGGAPKFRERGWFQTPR